MFPPGCEMPGWAISKDAAHLVVLRENRDVKQQMLGFVAGPACRRAFRSCLLSMICLTACCVVAWHLKGLARHVNIPIYMQVVPMVVGIALAVAEFVCIREIILAIMNVTERRPRRFGFAWRNHHLWVFVGFCLCVSRTWCDFANA